MREHGFESIRQIREDEAMDLENIAILRHDLNVFRGLVLEEALSQLGGNRQVGVGHRPKETAP